MRWSLANADTSTNGWIVQRVFVTHHVTDAAGATVVPGTGGYDGFPASWTPYWEGWQVRSGQVFVGGTTSPHVADTFSQPPIGAHTEGWSGIAGRADFYPNLTLPASFVPTNTAPAFALPMTTTNPSLTGGTGALDHIITASWDSIGGTGVTGIATI